LIEKQVDPKHVESLFFPYLDESSNLSGSTEAEKSPFDLFREGIFRFSEFRSEMSGAKFLLRNHYQILF